MLRRTQILLALLLHLGRSLQEGHGRDGYFSRKGSLTRASRTGLCEPLGLPPECTQAHRIHSLHLPGAWLFTQRAVFLGVGWLVCLWEVSGGLLFSYKSTLGHTLKWNAKFTFIFPIKHEKCPSPACVFRGNGYPPLPLGILMWVKVQNRQSPRAKISPKQATFKWHFPE